MEKRIFIVFFAVIVFHFGANAQQVTDSVGQSMDSMSDPVDQLIGEVNTDSIFTRDTSVFLKRIKELQQQNDSTLLLLDSVTLKANFSDSVEKQNVLLHQVVDSLHKQVDTLIWQKKQNIATISRLEEKNRVLEPLNNELSRQIQSLQTKIENQNKLINQQIVKIKEKENLFNQKELIYRNAIQETTIDKVKLEGHLQSMNSKLDGKDREIELLAESITDQKSAIAEKNAQINEVRQRRKLAISKLDTLKSNLQETEKELLVAQQELKYTRKELSNVKEKLSSVTNKKKKIRLVQGVAMRTIRTPLYALTPKSSAEPDKYVIHNENAGSFEFDFITGATFRLYDFSKENAEYTSDVGFFVGFGGKNLFKNFYLGPNLKIFDVVHITAGINIAEFRLLKSGFHEGDAVNEGSSIPTVNKWELSPYFGITFDLNLITKIAAKL